MVERRRKPLILSSTKFLVQSLLNSPSTADQSKDDDKSPSLMLPAGILRFSEDKIGPLQSKTNSLDDSALVALSTAVLKKLAVTSGSLVLIKNTETNIRRIGQVVVLDPPGNYGHLVCDDDVSRVPNSRTSRTMLVFPSYNFGSDEPRVLDCEVAYLSPLLAFNLDLHVSCLNSLVRQGNDKLVSLFCDSNGGDESCGEVSDDSLIHLALEPLAQLPRYASHLRVSFVKIPECGTLESLKGSSSVEAQDRQEMIDLALHDYFKADRFLARGDVFSICIHWNCNSVVCIHCSKSSQNRNDDVVYFKVVAMEPSDEAILRINCTKTALVLGGTVPSALPPDLLIGEPKDFAPFQQDTVKSLAYVLAPPLCPSALASKFRVSVLLYGPAGCGKRTVVRYISRRLGLHVVEFSCHNLMADRKAFAQAFNTAQRYSPAILLLRHFDVLRNLSSNDGSPNDQVGLISEVASVIREFTQPVPEDNNKYSDGKSDDDPDAGKLIRHQVLFVASAESSEGLPPTVRRCFSHEISMGSMDEEQRAAMISQLLQRGSNLLSTTGLEDSLKDIVGQTSGFMPRDLRALIADAGSNLISKGIMQADETDITDKENSHADKAEQKDESCNSIPQVMGKEYLPKALERSKKRNASALGTPKVPNVKWEDVGGLEDVKKSILDTVQLPLLHKDLFSSGLRKRSGVLLYGPPGTGKTLLAKAVATECSLNFLSVKGPELINMYIGESEKNVRDIFQKARSARPCVIFFDELDSLAPARGASGDSGGVMDRVVSQMLAEIDGLNDSTQDLFIIGASNRPDLIDAALLRPGRFDKLLYVGVNSDASYRERVLKALTRKFTLHQDISLYSIAKRCPQTFTGADMYALCADAWFHAAKRKVLGSDSESSSQVHQADSVVVEYDDFIKVLAELSPSLSIAELKKYEALRDQFEGSSK
ncbi:peroxisomal ATPase PEX6 isoform X2 [Mercurialis annua]|uniref:peroxisomal ATPase PEX6 isoform X2 n=1 Tax=Mercurialis annua TaxID=3986 RepID=UPI00215FC43F|nr:peroxisomal ATPase PEX6 isoform X2 [Mercurialis annua]